MYRLGFIIVTVLAILVGLLVGTLNHQVVSIDLLWFQLSWPLGLALICALAAGAVVGLTVSWLFSVLPLRHQLRKARRQESGPAGLPTGKHD